MRVVCQNVDEFLECLRSEILQGSSLYQDTIRVSIIHKPTEGGRESLRDEVILQASTIVIVQETSDYLLEIGQFCGFDRKDDPPEMEGSEKANLLKKQIQDYADQIKCKLLPGMIDL